MSLQTKTSRRLSIVTALAVLSCAASSHPPAAAPVAECGDTPDIDDACPLIDGCPGTTTSSNESDDGCPTPGGIPFGVHCDADEGRFAAIATEIRRRPKLSTLRVVSSVPGCASAVRDGLVHAGATVPIEPVMGHDDARCTRWARFEIAAWDARKCGP